MSLMLLSGLETGNLEKISYTRAVCSKPYVLFVVLFCCSSKEFMFLMFKLDNLRGENNR